MNNSDNPGFLLHKIGALMEHVSDKVLFEEFGIGFSQFKILFALEYHDGIQQKEIANFLGQTEASISRQIKLLVAAKLVTVNKDDKDKKKHLISATSRGRQMSIDAFALLNTHYTPVLSVLSAHEQQELAAKLFKIHEALAVKCSVYFSSKK